MLGGDVRAGSQKNETYKLKTFSVLASPTIAYFLLKNLAIGLNINYGYQNSNKSEIVMEDVAVGAFLRYYLRFKRHGFFAEGIGQYGESRITYKYPDPLHFHANSESSFGQFSFGGGYCYFLNKNVSIEALYQYNKRNINEKTFPVKGNVQTIMVGLQFYF